MYWPSVTDLHAFYGSTPGGLARQYLAANLRERWPDAHELAAAGNILGFGYAAPYLKDMLQSPRNLAIAACPGPQGAKVWPAGGTDRGNLSLQCADSQLPFPDSLMDKVLLVHALEFTANPPALLEEISRVLKPGGRLIVIVPNRRSVWARRETTPFGYGHPFSPWQLETLLSEAGLNQLSSDTELFFPPSSSRLVVGLTGGAGFWAKLLRSILKPLALGGVVVAEAEKQIAAPLRAVPERLSRYRGIAAVPATPASRAGL